MLHANTQCNWRRTAQNESIYVAFIAQVGQAQKRQKLCSKQHETYGNRMQIIYKLIHIHMHQEIARTCIFVR